jgi:hypothetical protein
MSRKTIFESKRLLLIGGNDHVFGNFLQLYDRDLQHETPEGEGLIFDWSEGMGIEKNLTGESNKEPPLAIVMNYIKHNNKPQK